MMLWFESLGWIVGLSLAVVSLLLLFVAHKTGWKWQTFKAHWTTTGDGAGSGIVAFILILVILGGLFATFNAHASDWFQYSEIYMGVENTMKSSPMCEGNAVDDRITSNGGVRQHVYQFNEQVGLIGNYTHHSCAVGVDDRGYDALGIQLIWRFER